jgi:hypothetical protein
MTQGTLVLSQCRVENNTEYGVQAANQPSVTSLGSSFALNVGGAISFQGGNGGSATLVGSTFTLHNGSLGLIKPYKYILLFLSFLQITQLYNSKMPPQ